MDAPNVKKMGLALLFFGLGVADESGVSFERLQKLGNLKKNTNKRKSWRFKSLMT